MTATIIEIPCFINLLPGKLLSVEALQAPFKDAHVFETHHVRGARVELVNGRRYDVYFFVEPEPGTEARLAVACLNIKGIGNAEGHGHEEARQLAS